MEGRRLSGLQRPFHKLQVSTWFMFPILVIHYFAFLYPLLWDHIAAKVLVTFCFLFSCIVCAYSGYLCCAVDPSDDALRDPASNSQWRADSVYCYVCELNVHKCSKHCPYCDKCVERLDHHCKWLNTCIGAKNYKYFLTVIWGVTLLTTTSLVLSSAFLIESFAFRDRFINRLAASNEASVQSVVRSDVIHIPMVGVKTILIVSVILLVPLVGIIYQLAGFHLMLLMKGMTTHEYVTIECKRIRDNEELAREADIVRSVIAAGDRRDRDEEGMPPSLCLETCGIQFPSGKYMDPEAQNSSESISKDADNDHYRGSNTEKSSGYIYRTDKDRASEENNKLSGQTHFFSGVDISELDVSGDGIENWSSNPPLGDSRNVESGGFDVIPSAHESDNTGMRTGISSIDEIINRYDKQSTSNSNSSIPAIPSVEEIISRYHQQSTSAVI